VPSTRRVITTERQKWTALRDAKRLSQRAEIYEKQGKANDAEQMAEEALALEQQVRGPWHIDVARRLDQVADLYTAHKKERAAEPLYERARAIRQRGLGAHPDVYERDGGELRPKRSQPAERAVPTNPPPSVVQNP
jgi:tetratricopeptide (TPR) repeat protein